MPIRHYHLSLIPGSIFKNIIIPDVMAFIAIVFALSQYYLGCSGE